jgi:hypothetical protein
MVSSLAPGWVSRRHASGMIRVGHRRRAPWHASYDYYNFEETPTAAAAMLPPAAR